ncbi:peptidylprolyl isomerase [Acidovorax sp. Root402]|uniref:peptidylprolyl isomerase n=1 Tax=Acidovorax sp. Root402 TaxID=1736527 RepID=UPI000A73920C
MSGCGTGSCGCGSTDSSVAAAPASTLTPTQAAAYEALVATMDDAPQQATLAPQAGAMGGMGSVAAEVARVNGVALNVPHELLDEEALRQRACTELLRQAAQQAGLLSASDTPGVEGAISVDASNAIEQLLERELDLPDPSEEACRRYHEAHPAAHAQGERAQLRHVLFAVTPGVDVKQLRLRAEALLIELRCADDGGAQFAKAAAQWSNCPSGQQGGDLGWLTRADCAPEFAREVFGGAEIGVLARLVHSRFGLHVVEVVARDPGQQRSFEEVRQAIALTLRQQAWVNALRQYLQLLAGAAVVEGVVLDAADTPLVQ